MNVERLLRLLGGSVRGGESAARILRAPGILSLHRFRGFEPSSEWFDKLVLHDDYTAQTGRA